jgi:hypothetical protein
VVGVQQLPLAQTCPASASQGVPQLTLVPQAFCTLPQVAAPHEGAGHVVQVPPEHWVPFAHPPQATDPLPHAFGTLPHRAPPSLAHSGGVATQTPAAHCCPEGQVHFKLLPQPSATVPQRVVVESGVQVRGAHAPPASIVV